MSSFDEEDGENEEEEEILVYANFEEGTVDGDIFQQPDLKFKIIGLDSDTPVAQLGDNTFKGTWIDALGTKVFFEEDFSPEHDDPVFTKLPQKMLKYKCMTSKTLELSRIFLKHKTSGKDLVEKNSNSTKDLGMTYCDNQNKDLMELAQSTTDPDSSTNAIMNDILEECAMEITD